MKFVNICESHKCNVLVNVYQLAQKMYLVFVYTLFEYFSFTVLMGDLDVWWKTGTDSMLKNRPCV
jgi:hypothetical protein